MALISTAHDDTELTKVLAEIKKHGDIAAIEICWSNRQERSAINKPTVRPDYQQVLLVALLLSWSELDEKIDIILMSVLSSRNSELCLKKRIKLQK